MKKRQTNKLVKSAKRTAPARKPAKAARPAAKTTPAGPPSVTPYLVVKGADRAMDFYKRAFGARERMRMPGPDGKTVMHAELTIGSSTVYMSDEFPDMGPGPRSPETLHGTTTTLHLGVPDVDAAFKRAVEAGAQVRMAPADMFWGDRYAKVSDPFGHEWGMSTPKEKLTPQQLKKRAEQFFAQMGKPQG
ncbi:MAG: VOC family protein [Candidatus Rokuibacteriota bacterium]